MELEKLSNDELISLVEEIKKIIYKRKKEIERIENTIEEIQGKYEFEFNAKRKDKRPYVAKLRYKYKTATLDWKFEYLPFSKIDGFFVVRGIYYAKENDILDILNSDKRRIYIIKDGDLLELFDPDESNGSNNLLTVKQALKGDFDYNNLIEFVTGEIDEESVLDELKD
ncbi:TPA: hypothetical protein KQG29_001519 [Clostridioides difficile]|nr:hypothetical protein [Clostridioides difficile]